MFVAVTTLLPTTWIFSFLEVTSDNSEKRNYLVKASKLYLAAIARSKSLDLYAYLSVALSAVELPARRS